MGRPPMGWAPAVFGRFLKPGGRGGRPKLELAFPTMPLVRENARSASSNFCDDDEYTLRMKDVYARALYKADGATLDDLRESVTTLQGAERTARRVLGGGHPSTVEIGETLRYTRAALRARETRA